MMDSRHAPLPLGQMRDCRAKSPTARKNIDGIIIQSSPREGFCGNWQTENGRAVIRRRGPHDGWTLLIDGQETGTDTITNLTESVRANAWAIKPTTPK